MLLFVLALRELAHEIQVACLGICLDKYFARQECKVQNEAVCRVFLTAKSGIILLRCSSCGTRSAGLFLFWSVLVQDVPIIHPGKQLAMQSTLARAIGLTAVFLLLSGGCRTIPSEQAAQDPLAAIPHFAPMLPSNQRAWRADLAVLPYANFEGSRVTVHNVRDFVYQNDEEFVVNYRDEQFDLDQIETVDFLVVPFNNAPSLAHTMLSFGIRDGRYLGVSVEARLEEGETYSPIAGALRQYELMYVIATERDLIGRRTGHRSVDVFLYPTKATKVQAQALFVDVMKRVNKLASEPEYYDTITNNCTSNIVRHINRLQPGSIPFDLRILLPGYSDQLAHDLGLLDTDVSLTLSRPEHRITELANLHIDSEQFSQRIRR